MRTVLIAITGSMALFANDLNGKPDSYRTPTLLHAIDARCVANAGIACSSDGNMIMCFDYWKVHIIALDGNQSKLRPEPRGLKGEKIVIGAHVDKNIWLLAATRSIELFQRDGLKTTFILFDFNQGKPIAEWAGHRDGPRCVSYSPMKDCFVSAASFKDQTICMWDRKTQKKLAELNLHEELKLQQLPLNDPNHIALVDMTLESSGRYLALAMDVDIVVVRDLKEDKWHWVTRKHKSRPAQTLVRFLGKDLVIVGRSSLSKSDSVEVYNWQSGKLLKAIDLAAHHSLCDVAVSSDGKLFAIGARGKGYHVSLWDRRAFRHVTSFSVNDKSDIGFAPAVKMTFSHDGKRLVASGVDCIIRIWDLAPFVMQLE